MNLATRLRKDEGLRLHVYRCPAGRWTIGYGRNVDPNGGKGITKIEAEILLHNDVVEVEKDLRQAFPGWDEFDQVRQLALANMRYQLGPGGFRGFKKMIAFAKRQEWMRAFGEALDSRWAVQDPNRAQRVARELRDGVIL